MTRLLLAAVAAVALSAAPAVAADPAWLEAAPVTGPVADLTDPVAGADGDGAVTAAWVRHFPKTNSFIVEAAHRPPGGSFAKQVLQTAGGGATTGLALAVNGRGERILAWQRASGAGPQVFFALNGRGAGRFAAPQPVVPAGEPEQPAVAVNEAGAMAIVWRDDFGRDVVLRYRPPGGTLGAPEPVSGSIYGVRAPRVVLDEAGRAVVAWVHGEDGFEKLRSRVRERDGTWGDAGSLPAGPAPAEAPALGVDAAGDVLAVWRHIAASPHEVRGARLPAGAPGWQAVPPLGESSSDGAHPAPVLDVHPTGAATALWRAPASMLQAAPWTAGGHFDAPSSLGATAPGEHAVAHDATGAAVAAWTGFDQADEHVDARRRPSGGAWSDPARLTVYQPFTDFRDLVLAADGRGDAVAAWLEHVQVLEPDADTFLQLAALDGAPPAFGAVEVPGEGQAGSWLAFDAAATDNWSPPVTLTWDFGDGATGTGSPAAHRYAAAGTYTVGITATDAVGHAATRTRQVAVTAPPAGQDPGTQGGRVDAKLRHRAKVRRGRTRFTRLKLVGLPAAAELRVTCRGKGCPFERRRPKVADGATKRNLKPLMKRRGRLARLKRGARVKVHVRAPEMVGKVVVLKARRRGAPRRTQGCLLPGSFRRIACPA